jgi:5-methylcytosine-specific restriction endonuclease McrA
LLKDIYKYVFERDDNTCQCPFCSGLTSLERSPHHIKLKSQGGEDLPENLIVLCMDCHWRVHQNLIKIDLETKEFSIKEK